MTPEQIAKAANDYEPVPVIGAAKRCGVQWDPWMGDWFTSWSPRNSNSNAEGTWDHWCDLAVKILRDPMTAIVRPEAHAVAQQLTPRDYYTESRRLLTDEELAARMADKSVAS